MNRIEKKRILTILEAQLRRQRESFENEDGFVGLEFLQRHLKSKGFDFDSRVIRSLLDELEEEDKIKKIVLSKCGNIEFFVNSEGLVVDREGTEQKTFKYLYAFKGMPGKACLIEKNWEIVASKRIEDAIYIDMPNRAECLLAAPGRRQIIFRENDYSYLRISISEVELPVNLYLGRRGDVDFSKRTLRPHDCYVLVPNNSFSRFRLDGGGQFSINIPRSGRDVVIESLGSTTETSGKKVNEDDLEIFFRGAGDVPPTENEENKVRLKARLEQRLSFVKNGSPNYFQIPVFVKVAELQTVVL